MTNLRFLRERLDRAVAAALDRVRALTTDDPDINALQRILDVLRELADETDLWSDGPFPAGNGPLLYPLSEDPDKSLSLSLIVATHTPPTLPHDHGTWVCIAGVAGAESNQLYRRIDDRTVEGYAALDDIGEVCVQAGDGLTLMPDDIHSVRVVGEDAARHLHLYGRALGSVVVRHEFDPDVRKCWAKDFNGAERYVVRRCPND